MMRSRSRSKGLRGGLSGSGTKRPRLRSGVAAYGGSSVSPVDRPPASRHMGMSDTVTMTSNAARRIREILVVEPGKEACASPSMAAAARDSRMNLPSNAARNDDDLVIEKDGARVVIDSMSLVYMGGAEIDFVDDLIGQAFKVKIPTPPRPAAAGRASRSR